MFKSQMYDRDKCRLHAREMMSSMNFALCFLTKQKKTVVVKSVGMISAGK